MKAADKIELELEAIQRTLKVAREHGLEAEVIWSAMNHHHSSSVTNEITFSLEVALSEWDI